MTEPSRITHILDEHSENPERNYQLDFTYNPTNHTLTCGIKKNDFYSGAFEKGLAHKLSIQINGQAYKLDTDANPNSIYTHSVVIQNINSEETVPFSVKIGRVEKPFGEYQINADGTIKGSETRKLSVVETRGIAAYPHSHYYPYPELTDTDSLITPITDLHTHSSAQISADALMELALKKEPFFLYPTRLLDKLGIHYSGIPIGSTKRVPFPPLAHLEPESSSPEEPAVPLALLNAESIEKLKAAFIFPPDKQASFAEMELIAYQYRYPFTKDPTLIGDMFRGIAEDYEKQEIQYAEISTVGLLDKAYLQTLHEALPKIEEDTGVQLRFLLGIPRNFKDEQIKDLLEHLKTCAQSPYIVGLDILGYENNKTEDFAEHLREAFKWAEENDPGFIIRVHAGENGKNQENVKQALKIAEEFPSIRLRIGHALYGMDDETMVLAKTLSDRGQLMLEFNPISNEALNSIDIPQELPLPRCNNEGITSVFGSDGGGTYLATGKELALFAQVAGATTADMQNTHKAELAHIRRQAVLFDKKVRNFPTDFFDHLPEKVPNKNFQPEVRAKYSEDSAKSRHTLASILKSKKTVTDHDQIEAETEGKKPILIIGAAGTSWQRISANTQKEISIGLTMLTHLIDPDKAYFATGRTKDQGVGKELESAIVQRKSEAPGAKDLIFLGLMIKPEQFYESFRENHFTHLETLDGDLVQLPLQIIDYADKKDATRIAIGGSSYTSDIIVKGMDDTLLMAGPDGASTSKAYMMGLTENDPTNSIFASARGLISLLAQDKKTENIFKPDFDISKLDEYYRKAEAEVEARQQAKGRAA